jgi:core-2/I-Branching enzyme
VSITIGFAILSYNEPQQLHRLITTLNAMFGGAHIVCHHNFTQCPLDETSFPKNVQFAQPHINTQWGHISVPMAALRAFALLRQNVSPDWFVLLSGSDYPVRPASDIVDELSKSNYDAYLDHREILHGVLPPGQTAQDGGFGRPDWIPLAYDRYCTSDFQLPWPSRRLLLSGSFPFRKRHFLIRNQLINKLRRAFVLKQSSRIYGGAFWFHAAQRAIDRLLDHPSTQRLLQYYRKRFIPEESIFHTALANQPDLRLFRANNRYEDWTAGGRHPKWLDDSDLRPIIDSGALFARKFRDQSVLRLIETTLLHI